MILYTSGTTGRPKGVLHTHNSIHALISQLGDHWLVDDRRHVPGPVADRTHRRIHLCLRMPPAAGHDGGADGALGRRMPRSSLMTAERCTHMAGATPFLERLARRRRARRHAAARSEGVHLRRRIGVAVADPQGRRLFRASRGHPGLRLDRSAGDDGRRTGRPRTRGGHRRPCRASPTSSWSTARSVRADRRCWSATCIPRTRPDPSTTRDTSAPAISAAGSTTSTWWSPGRAKDIIIRNGENISPKEIEDILVGHRGIAEIAVVGVPDERTGERACAVIVPADQPAPDVDRPARVADAPGRREVQNA